jgi:hypothetical protein
MSFAFGRPSYGRAVRCVGAPNLRTCRRALRCGRALGCVGAQICGRADVPYVVDMPCICVADVRWGMQLAEVPCVALGPNLRTGLVLRLGAHLADVPCVALGRTNLGEAVLKSLPPSQNLFLSILQLIF